MLLNIFGFLNISFADILDIVAVAIFIYLAFRWIRGSAAMNIFVAVILLFVLRVVVAAFNMRLMNALLGTFIDVGVIALIVIFQPEVRHFLMKLGSRYGMAGKGRDFFNRLMGVQEQKMTGGTVNEIAEACRAMSASKTGALIVFPRKDLLDYIVETGDIVDAKVTRRLIMNIFFKNSPLHDGAMIIVEDRIVAARCTLPITGRSDIPARYGMRHKAAIGISEETDADVVVVSEETGEISFVRGGNIKGINNINELKLLLGAGEGTSEEKRPKEERQ